MKRSIWDSKSKARIVLEGLQGRSVASLCSEYQITQSMYYRWRDTFLANAAQAFETSTRSRREERLSAENQKLKQAVGELTLELKKRLVSGRRRTAQVQLQRDAELLPLIEALKMEHPFWGYCRVWATLRHKSGMNVNAKRVGRLMRLHGLGVRRAVLRAKHTPTGSKPRPVRPCQWWDIDMTKVMTESGWVYVLLVVDWFSKKVVAIMLTTKVEVTSGCKPWRWAFKRTFPKASENRV